MPDPGPLALGDPEEIGGYRLTGVLGEGGQGVVYLGQTPSGRRVAVKVLHARMAADPKIRERFLREAEVTHRVAAFCTATVFDTGIIGDRPYLVSEYIPGPSLLGLVTGDGPRAGSGLDRLAVTTLTALAAIHRAGIIHRDFKPSNVILGPEGPVVIDFGIARVLDRTTTRSALVGTPAYLAPEQLNGHEADAASDVFGWAATMVYAATGHPAFPGSIPAVVMNAVLTRKPNLAGVPDHLRPLLAACLVKEPGARPTVADLLTTLTREEPVTGHEKQDRPVPRRVRVAAVAAVVAVSLISAVLWLGKDALESLTSASPAATGPTTGKNPASPVRTPSTVPFGMPVGKPFTGHTTSVTAVAVAQLGGRPVVVSGSKDETVRVSDLATGAPVGRPFIGHGDWIWSVAVAQLEGRPVVVSGSKDETVRVWDLATGTLVGRPFTGHTNSVTAVAVAQLGGRPVVVSGGVDETVRVSDLATGSPVGRPFTGHTDAVLSVAVAQLGGRPVVVSGGDDETVRVSDLATGSPVGKPFTGHTDAVLSVAVAQLGGRPVVVSGGDDETVRVSDLTTGALVGESFTGHTEPVNSVAVAQLAGRPVVVSGGDDETVRVWDLATGAPVGRPFTDHTNWVWSVAVAQPGGRPVAVSSSEDGTVRVWSLSPPYPSPSP
ncbi:serine/threonine-protein kinase [Streptosporangium sp. NBC_01756]|uniref:serine/threonine-protein kinase n=1 Tax=Streptosporangium sp. NBC_01756 TaxID=2975950 RepID=UPI002DDA9372|nr:serine/threonine-protein kinase [Streptosporangium sp. NBC_01756]WSC89921.1 serine/threonine protein kinase [Streptosporangium sp. NBC_01756]